MIERTHEPCVPTVKNGTKKNVELDSCRSTIRGLRIAHHIRTTTRSPRRYIIIPKVEIQHELHLAKSIDIIHP